MGGRSDRNERERLEVLKARTTVVGEDVDGDCRIDGCGSAVVHGKAVGAFLEPANLPLEIDPVDGDLSFGDLQLNPEAIDTLDSIQPAELVVFVRHQHVVGAPLLHLPRMVRADRLALGIHKGQFDVGDFFLGAAARPARPVYGIVACGSWEILQVGGSTKLPQKRGERTDGQRPGRLGGRTGLLLGSVDVQACMACRASDPDAAAAATGDVRGRRGQRVTIPRWMVPARERRAWMRVRSTDRSLHVAATTCAIRGRRCR